MGLLMTPELGPRVRLGVVTTDLPLIPDQRNTDDISALDFCRLCQTGLRLHWTLAGNLFCQVVHHRRSRDSAGRDAQVMVYKR